jgi:hypothetical protein
MYIRKVQRELSIIAIAACAPLVFGCASTNRFVVDPGRPAPLVFAAVAEVGGTKTTFDAAGGVVDSTATVVTGMTRAGESATVPMAKVRHLYLRDDGDLHRPIRLSPKALADGARWRPDGRVQYIALRDGDVVDARKVPTAIDAPNRVLYCTPAAGPVAAIPFDQVAYVQIRDTHPGRTILCVLGGAMLVFAVAVGIALHNEPIGLGDGDW